MDPKLQAELDAIKELARTSGIKSSPALSDIDKRVFERFNKALKTPEEKKNFRNQLEALILWQRNQQQ